MFFSRLILNPHSRQARRDVARPYEMHRTLMRAFPPEPEGGPGRVLWRLDIDRRTGQLTVLVQSEKQADWNKLTATAADYFLVPDDPGTENPAQKERHLQFAPGQRLAFRLRANPTVKRNGKRLGLLTDDAQLSWLRRKGQSGGFAVQSAQIVPEGFRRGQKTIAAEEQHTLSHFAVRFDGLLTVTDPEGFSKTLAEGIGSAKAFGFGLLSLAPAQRSDP